MLTVLEVKPDLIGYRVQIHESADVDAAMSWWAERIAVRPERFARRSLERHNPKTVRNDVGEDYHGCSCITVRKSKDLYRTAEGTVSALGRQACTARGGAGVSP